MIIRANAIAFFMTTTFAALEASIFWPCARCVGQIRETLYRHENS
jgi:hypothetical protein